MTRPTEPGSIYEGLSPRGQRALANLRVAFQQAGFYAEKERRTEGTLRVYPERRARYPLLNPVFVKDRREPPVPIQSPSIVCAILSDGDRQIGEMLKALPAIQGLTFYPAPDAQSGRYVLHGHISIPIRLLGSAREQNVDYSALVPVLAALHLGLSSAGLPALERRNSQAVPGEG